MREVYTSCSSHDFSPVIEALHQFERETGRCTLALGGWDVDDAHIRPPAPLLRRLAGIRPRLLRYAYPRDFATAKEQAAQTLGWRVTLGGERLRAGHAAVLQNSTQGLLLALAALRDTGVARVVVAAPSYYAAVDACHHLGLATTLVPTRDYMTGALDVERLVSTMRGGARAALLLTNPAYSLGVEYGWEHLRALLAALPDGTPVLLDETRLGLSWRDEAPWYAADLPPNVLILRSPSKIFLVNGLKTSFLYGPKSVISHVERLHEALIGSVAGHTEAVALAYLEAWRSWIAEVEQERDGPLRRWRRALVERLAHNLAVIRPDLEACGYTLSPITSGPYVLAGISTVHAPDLDCERAARERGVLLMTDRYFFHEHPNWSGFRLNLCGDPTHARTALSRVFPSPSAEYP